MRPKEVWKLPTGFCERSLYGAPVRCPRDPPAVLSYLYGADYMRATGAAKNWRTRGEDV